jgi:hypothetical protein
MGWKGVKSVHKATFAEFKLGLLSFRLVAGDPLLDEPKGSEFGELLNEHKEFKEWAKTCDNWKNDE